jgi:hypothetical protein
MTLLSSIGLVALGVIAGLLIVPALMLWSYLRGGHKGPGG